jgi:ribosome-associated protein
MEALDKALLCLKIIKERKAVNPVLFEVGRLTSITDYFLIASGNSIRQVQAIARHLSRRMREESFKAYGLEGEQEGHWVLIDYNDVVIHIFFQPIREFYDLEGLWIEAPRIDPDAAIIENAARRSRYRGDPKRQG